MNMLLLGFLAVTSLFTEYDRTKIDPGHQEAVQMVFLRNAHIGDPSYIELIQDEQKKHNISNAEITAIALKLIQKTFYEPLPEGTAGRLQKRTGVGGILLLEYYPPDLAKTKELLQDLITRDPEDVRSYALAVYLRLFETQPAGDPFIEQIMTTDNDFSSAQRLAPFKHWRSRYSSVSPEEQRQIIARVLNWSKFDCNGSIFWNYDQFLVENKPGFRTSPERKDLLDRMLKRFKAMKIKIDAPAYIYTREALKNWDKTSE